MSSVFVSIVRVVFPGDIISRLDEPGAWSQTNEVARNGWTVDDKMMDSMIHTHIAHER